MFFGKKKDKKVYNLVDMLRARPGEMYVCELFMAVYCPETDDAIIIPGDYTGLGEELTNKILCMKLTAHLN